ncbi:MAG: hypothetical protein RL258_1328 [Pseudomonadota bacterium]|jgi:CubicO group peptidase (beta-lactamase class C family)
MLRALLRSQCLLGFALSFFILPYAGAQSSIPNYAFLYMRNGFSFIEDPILLGDGRAEDATVSAAPEPVSLVSRQPTSDEARLFSEVAALYPRSRAQAIAFLDENGVVLETYRNDYLRFTKLVSMSMSKSILAVATGAALCEGRLSMDTKASDLIPRLKGTDLGEAAVGHLLTMTSGTWEGNHDSSIIDDRQRGELSAGKIGLLDILATEKVSSAVNPIFSSKRRPGQVFSYRSTDPLVLAHMIERATGETYHEILRRTILHPAGVADTVIVGRDYFGYPRADGVLRMLLQDWMRVALWIRGKYQSNDCLGGFLREATTKRVDNRPRSNYPQAFKGYGYYFGVDSDWSRDTFWAVGFGGQRIGWSRSSTKILVTFGNSDEHSEALERIYERWLRM